MTEPQTRPAGIDGSTLPGPYGVGAYAAKLREFLRERPRVQLFGEVWNLRVSRAKVYLELRDSDGAVACSMWRDDFDALRLGEGALADGAQVVVAGGLDYYAGSRTSSPSFSFAITALRVAGEGDLLAQLDRLRKTLDAEGLFAPQKRLRAPGAAADDRRRHRRGRQGPRRRPRRPAAPRLAGPPRVGVRAGPGSPRRAADHRRRCRISPRRARSTSSSSRAAAARSPTCSASATRRSVARSRCWACP